MAIFGSIKKTLMLLVVVILILLAGAPSIYFYQMYRKVQEQVKNPTEAAKADAQEVIAKVGKLIVLPVDEEPTLAVISDVSKLADQPFFAHAQNGDKVLIYTKAKKAILYRPETNLIIDVAPVNIGNAASPSGELQSTPTPTLAPTSFLWPTFTPVPSPTTTP